VARLQRLGLTVRTLTERNWLTVERYRPTSMVEGEPPRPPDPSPALRHVRVAIERERFEALAGSYYVPLDQPLAHLAVAALEPDTGSSWFAHHIVTRLDAVLRVTSPP
jgi:hypothetical protein